MALRKARKTPFATVTFTYCILSLGIFAAVTAIIGESRLPPCGTLFKTVSLLVGYTSGLAQIFQTVASRTLPAGLVSLIRPAEVVIVCFLDLTIFQHPVHHLSLIGSSIITVAMVFIPLRSYYLKTISDKPGDERTSLESKLFWLLNK